MKRSEAVIIIAKQVEKWFDKPSIGYEDECSEILRSLEDAGMLPPFCHEVFYKVWRDGGSGYRWEKE